MRIRLGVKFAAFFTLFGVLLLAGLTFLIKDFTEKTFMNRYTANLRIMLEMTEQALDITPEELRRYGQTLEKDDRYEELQGILDEAKGTAQVEYLYIIYAVSEESAIYLFEGALPNENREALGGLGDEVGGYMEDYQANLRQALTTGAVPKSLDVTKSEEFGYLASAFLPLKDEEGNTIAVLGIDKDMTEIVTEIERWQRDLLTKVGVGLGISLMLLILIVRFLVVRPARRLEAGVERMAKGELGVTVPAGSRDEIGEISRMFNRMSLNIENHIREVEELNQGYDRFVPSQIFQLLGRQSVVDVRLGDQVRTEMALVSMQVDDFDRLSRRLAANPLFTLINQVLKESIPPVLEHGGVIEFFEKAGFQAFYTESVQDALKAAVTLSQRIKAAVREGRIVSEPPVKLTTGIAYGPVMVGVVGQEKRMNNITISEQTVIAGYLQGMGKRYCANILITGTAAREIAGFEEIYHSRFLGFLQIEALGFAEKLYDVFDGDDEEMRHKKAMTKNVFENGVRLYSAGLYGQARSAFIEVLKQFRKDDAAREYLYRCNQKEQDEPEDGAIRYLEVL